ncbi:tripartite tricarboxylate transporter substrate binding protein [Variovorax sp. J31P207]|uniref:Bug family tripartite tricarboxylate transporter substrate binding protein n=1 Tax=Variovorax sp. J31P207 TaxID=3053510 RepID=UPI002575A2C6|nr:tripartite tricarboxylate transporter substrate binding protein [Variovorax sp. J31P207]MDM0072709.1 tripartite tricarboxylate transporter substrate binding protein [Variovorax sp. J31P207]
MKFLRTFSVGIVACVALGFWVPASAQPYPSRPIKLITGFPAGGPSDTVARSIAKALEDELQQPVVVDNRAGVSGILGLEEVTKSAPDGYTIGLLANTTTNALHFHGKKLDMESRFMPVGRFVTTHVALVVNPAMMDVKTISEFIDHLRRHPGTPVTSAGYGGIGHVGLELLALEQKVAITYVSYRGAAPAMQDVIGGQVPAMVIDVASALPFVQSGKLRPIAIVSTLRAPSLPDVSTAIEQGYKSLQIESSMGILVPPKTPQPTVDRLRAALKAAVNGKTYTAAVSQQSNARFFEDADRFKAWLQTDFDRFGEVIRIANIKAP